MWHPNNSVFVVCSLELLLKFLHAENPPDPRPKFVIDPITTPFQTMFVLGATTVSTPMVVMTTLSDRVTFIPVGYFRVSKTFTFDTRGEVVLIQV